MPKAALKTDLLEEELPLTQELQRQPSQEGPALLDMSFKSNLTHKTQEGALNSPDGEEAQKDLEQVTEQPEAEQTASNRASKELGYLQPRPSVTTDATEIGKAKGAIFVDVQPVEEEGRQPESKEKLDDVDQEQGPRTSVNEAKALLGLKAVTAKGDDDEVDRKIKAM